MGNFSQRGIIMGDKLGEVLVYVFSTKKWFPTGKFITVREGETELEALVREGWPASAKYQIKYPD